jgi:hypothetical protein
MTMRHTADVMVSMGAWIAALRPDPQVSEDDVYRVQLNDPEAILGPRDVRIFPTGGRQIFPGKNLRDWETYLEVRVLYPDVQTPQEGYTVAQTAVIDAEQISAALYDWSIVTDGIIQIRQELATIVPDNQGIIYSTRQVRVEFTRG